MVLTLWPSVVSADVLPAGHKRVNHELVFEDSELLNKQRVIAAPIAGFHGVLVVKPGERFSFSSKYGTKFYLVPKDEPLPTDFDPDLFSKWPNSFPPVQEISSVPWTSSVESALTVLTLDSISETGLVVSVVGHAENDSTGKPADSGRRWLIGAAVVIVGCLLCVAARRWFWQAYMARGIDHLSGPDTVTRRVV